MYAPIEQWPVTCAGHELPVRVAVPTAQDPQDSVVVVKRGGRHPILGAVDAIARPSGAVLTVVGRIDWRAPVEIPPLWRPACLPPGAGTAILNLIAERAQRPLRYRGPYPSAALYESLADSFDPSGPLEAFVAGGETSAATGEFICPEVEFTPRPFTRIAYGPICVQSRQGRPEAVYVLGARFAIEGRGGRQVVREADGAVVALEIAGVRVAEIVRLDRDGRPTGPPCRPPPLEAPYLERPLPAAVTAAIWASLVASAPVLLRPSLGAIAETATVWGDPGLAEVAVVDDRILVHAAFAESGLGPGALLAALTTAIAPLAFRLAQAHAEASMPLGAGS